MPRGSAKITLGRYNVNPHSPLEVQKVRRLARLGIAVFVVISLLVACGGASDPGGNTNPDPPKNAHQNVPEPDAAQLALANEILDLVNDIRATKVTCAESGKQFGPHTTPLTLNNNLMWAALLHSEDMAARMVMEHTGFDGSEVDKRVEETGYEWSDVGENIAYSGLDDVVDVVDNWKNSTTGHCENLMYPDFTEMGAARVQSDGDNRYYWTQVFGSPKPPR